MLRRLFGSEPATETVPVESREIVAAPLTADTARPPAKPIDRGEVPNRSSRTQPEVSVESVTTREVGSSAGGEVTLSETSDAAPNRVTDGPQSSSSWLQRLFANEEGSNDTEPAPPVDATPTAIVATTNEPSSSPEPVGARPVPSTAVEAEPRETEGTASFFERVLGSDQPSSEVASPDQGSPREAPETERTPPRSVDGDVEPPSRGTVGTFFQRMFA